MKAKSKEKREVPEKKLRSVSELENLIKNNKTFMICSIKGLPGRQFQAIKKKIRENVKVKVVKKSIILRAIDSSGIEIKKIKEFVKEDSTLLFSNLDAFELSGTLSENVVPVGARAGQIANEEVAVEPGPTDLAPGPAISELGAVGIKIAIEDGKISIKERKVIVRKGGSISEAVAGIMAKLDIKPFTVGFEPTAAYDNQDKKVYTEIKINKEKTLEGLKSDYGKALALAVQISYVCGETLRHILAKAASHEKAILNLIKSEKTEAQSTTEQVGKTKS